MMITNGLNKQNFFFKYHKIAKNNYYIFFHINSDSPIVSCEMYCFFFVLKIFFITLSALALIDNDETKFSTTKKNK